MDNGLLISSRMVERPFIQSGKVTHIYGPPKIGKSTLSATIALELAKERKKSIIISTERPIEIRMESMLIANEEYSKELLEHISTADIFTIDELFLTIENELQNCIQDVSLIIIDSLTSTYRIDAGPIALTLLRKALSTLQALAINNKLAIMFTNQVASKMDQTDDFRPVAAASTRSYSDITIRLSKKRDDSTEITFENILGEEEAVLDSFSITSAGIEEILQIFDFQM